MSDILDAQLIVISLGAILNAPNKIFQKNQKAMKRWQRQNAFVFEPIQLSLLLKLMAVAF